MDDYPGQKQKISEAINNFMSRNQLEIDIKLAKVPEKRNMVVFIRKALEGFPVGNLTWKDRPPYWRENVCFGDPNNEMKNNDSVNEMLLFLVDEWRRRHRLEPVDNSVPVPSGIRLASSPASDWQPIDQYCRIRDRLKTLPLPGVLLCLLLGIVEFWIDDASTYHEEAHVLEAIVDKMKLGRCSEQSLLESFCEFIGKYGDCGSDPNGDDLCEVRESVNESAESPGIVDAHPIRETEMAPDEDSLPELLSLREDSGSEVTSDLVEICSRMVSNQAWLNNNSWRCDESLDEEHLMHVGDDCENLPQDLSLEQHCELKNELLSNESDGEYSEMPLLNLQPFLSHWKNMKGINLSDIGNLAILRYLKKMAENHPMFCIHDFHQLDSNDLLKWPTEKKKLLLPYKDTDDGHFSLLFADRVEGNVCVLDSVQIDTEKLRHLKQSFVCHIPNTDGSFFSGWSSVDIECPRLKRDAALSDTCVSAYFTLMFAEAIVNDIKPVEFRQEFIPEFKVWLDYALQGDNPVDGLFVVLSRLGKNCGVCSRVEPFPNFLKLLRKHVVT